MKNKLRHFFCSVMVHFLILINLLFVYCGFALAQTCIVSSTSQIVIHGERRSLYVEVTAKNANSLVSAYGMDFSGHDWDKVWEMRSKAEEDCKRFTEQTKAHPKQASIKRQQLVQNHLISERSKLPNLTTQNQSLRAFAAEGILERCVDSKRREARGLSGSVNRCASALAVLRAPSSRWVAILTSHSLFTPRPEF